MARARSVPLPCLLIWFVSLSWAQLGPNVTGAGNSSIDAWETGPAAGPSAWGVPGANSTGEDRSGYNISRSNAREWAPGPAQRDTDGSPEYDHDGFPDDLHYASVYSYYNEYHDWEYTADGYPYGHEWNTTAGGYNITAGGYNMTGDNRPANFNASTSWFDWDRKCHFPTYSFARPKSRTVSPLVRISLSTDKSIAPCFFHFISAGF